MITTDEVTAFWLDEVGPGGWYKVDEALDARIRDRFADTWEAAQREGHLGWACSPRGALALLILLDQFPRNMFRGSARGYSSDRAALRVAKKAIDKGWDRRVAEPERQFFYLPLMHSENLEDQDRSVRLIKERMPETGAENLIHARAHREVIRRFGRFPHRNAEIGRTATAEERRYLDGGGYGAVLRSLKSEAA